MSIVVANPAKQVALELFLDDDLVLKLFGNNVTPGPLLTELSYNEISGGGYADIPLPFSGWDFTQGSPTRATYNERFTIQFTGAIASPFTVYGYYVVASDGTLRWAERFPAAAVPFTPINGSIIRIRPRFSASSIFND